MALRTLKTVLFLLLIVLVVPGPARSCFGPKLYVGTSSGPVDDVLYALVTLYVQEKTGVESLRVVIPAGNDPLAEIEAERVDLAFVDPGRNPADVLLAFQGYPSLVTGDRPQTDLQFTTVVPAVRKLAGLLQPDDVMHLVKKVENGQSAIAAVRAFYMDRRWI